MELPAYRPFLRLVDSRERMADSTRYQKLEPEADGAEPTHDAGSARWYIFDALRVRPDWAAWLRLAFEVVLVLAVLVWVRGCFPVVGEATRGPTTHERTVSPQTTSLGQSRGADMTKSASSILCS